jgi:hypothetical protein
MIRTGAAYAAEFISGYGVRPLRILRNILVLSVTFFLLTLWVSTTAHDSGVVFHKTDVIVTTHGASSAPTIEEKYIDLGKPNADVPHLIRYSILSLVTPSPGEYTPYGVMAAFSIIYFGISACLLALLFSSVFLRLQSE